jgi:hypothetical protein
MPPTETGSWSDPSRQGTQRRGGHRAIPVMIALNTVLFWVIIGLSGTAPSAALSHVGTVHHTQIAATTTTEPKRFAVHGHKEGPLAVAFSVLGVVVVAVFIVGLSSVSVRRRTRDRPAPKGRETPDHRLGPFG